MNSENGKLNHLEWTIKSRNLNQVCSLIPTSSSSSSTLSTKCLRQAFRKPFLGSHSCAWTAAVTFATFSSLRKLSGSSRGLPDEAISRSSSQLANQIWQEI